MTFVDFVEGLTKAIRNLTSGKQCTVFLNEKRRLDYYVHDANKTIAKAPDEIVCYVVNSGYVYDVYGTTGGAYGLFPGENEVFLEGVYYLSDAVRVVKEWLDDYEE